MLSQLTKRSRWVAKHIVVGLPLGLSILITGLIPLVIFCIRAFYDTTDNRSPFLLLSTSSGTATILLRTGIMAGLCITLQAAIALKLGPLLARYGGIWLIIAFSTPMLIGPAICAVLWKLLLDPMNGLPTQFLRVLRLGPLDWTSMPLAAFAVLIFVQTWIWGLVAGAAVAAMFGDDTRSACDIYLMDGGKSPLSNIWALWVTRRKSLIFLFMALTVENLRTFETIYVLTRGGPGSATETLAWQIYEASFVIVKPEVAAAWALMLLLVFNALFAAVLKATRGKLHEA
jgi:multiple sugar transport system permease protein